MSVMGGRGRVAPRRGLRGSCVSVCVGVGVAMALGESDGGGGRAARVRSRRGYGQAAGVSGHDKIQGAGAGLLRKRGQVALRGAGHQEGAHEDEVADGARQPVDGKRRPLERK